jgi:hypothetical protein
MFKSKLVIGFILLICLLGSSFAQSKTQVGIGVAIVDLQKLFEMSTSGGVGANASITVPIITAPGFRIEPEVGYFSASSSADITGTTAEETATSWTIGVGIFPQTVFSDFTLYYGGRVGYLTQKLTQEFGTSKDEETTSGFFIAPAIGGEYYFSDHFSIGAEALIVFATLTNEEDGRDYDVDLTLFQTRALIFFRFYF